jgi:hypothetical protein
MFGGVQGLGREVVAPGIAGQRVGLVALLLKAIAAGEKGIEP